MLIVFNKKNTKPSSTTPTTISTIFLPGQLHSLIWRSKPNLTNPSMPGKTLHQINYQELASCLENLWWSLRAAPWRPSIRPASGWCCPSRSSRLARRTLCTAGCRRRQAAHRILPRRRSRSTACAYGRTASLRWSRWKKKGRIGLQSNITLDDR